MSYTDDPLQRTVPVKTVHITEIRNIVDTKLSYECPSNDAQCSTQDSVDSRDGSVYSGDYGDNTGYEAECTSAYSPVDSYDYICSAIDSSNYGDLSGVNHN